MEEKTIGQVLQVAREEQGLSLAGAQRGAKIKKRYIQALEEDAYEEIPGESQARNLLMRYADFLELDVDVVLDAYDTDSPLMLYEVNAADIQKSGRKRRRKARQKKSALPFFYLFLLSAVIICFVSYTVWNYTHNRGSADSSDQSSYQMASDSSQASSSSSAASSSSESSSSEDGPTVTVTGDGASLVADIANAPDQVELTLSVTDAESWVSLSDTEWAEGILLSSENPTLTLTLDKQQVPTTTVTLGALEGVSIQVAGQELDLSSLTGPSALLTLNFK